MKTYKVYSLNLIFVYIMLGFLTLIAGFMAYRSVGESGVLWAVSPTMILCFGVLAWVWYFYLRIPVAITWHEEGVLEFKSPMGTTRVPAVDIIAIKAVPLSWGFIKITYNNGSLRIVSQITGLYELLGAIKGANPQVEIRGC
jgi:hypothetical protein